MDAQLSGCAVRYFWVNQNQTFKQEVQGGYLWSPKRNSNGHHNPFYEFMREVSPGDIVLSFYEAKIAALGIITSYCRENPKPAEFNNVGLNWSAIGWKVNVRFVELENKIRPKEYIDRLKRHLGLRYAPLTRDGNGLQGIYLTELSEAFAQDLFRLIGPQAYATLSAGRGVADTERLIPAAEPDIELWEKRQEQIICEDATLSETERRSLVLARVGQGDFRKKVQIFETRCRITSVDRMEHLRASHIRPWRDCESAEQRLDGENGLMLTPTMDHLFDKGFISFEGKGNLIISPVMDKTSLLRMGIEPKEKTNVGIFTQSQQQYLEYHREHILRIAHVNRP
jgi:hypothetical protein